MLVVVDESQPSHDSAEISSLLTNKGYIATREDHGHSTSRFPAIRGKPKRIGVWVHELPWYELRIRAGFTFTIEIKELQAGYRGGFMRLAKKRRADWVMATDYHEGTCHHVRVGGEWVE